MEGDHYTVTISPQPAHRGGGFRVRLGFYPADINRFSTTINETKCKTRASANATARRMAEPYGADILGLED